MQAQRSPDSIVHETLAPRANLQSKRLFLLCFDLLLGLGVPGGFALRRETSLAEDVLPPQDEEFEEDVSEPAPCAPDVPFIDSAVFVDEFLRYNVLRGEVGYVLKELVDDVRDNLKHSQGVNDGVCRWVFECLSAPYP